jgi:hypothetical protein
MRLTLIKEIEGFTEGAFLHWLHPKHGPFPDFAGEFEDQDGVVYTCGVWEVKDNAWVTFTFAEGEYPRTLRWALGIKMWCCPAKGRIYEFNQGKLKGQDLLKSIATHSIAIYTIPSYLLKKKTSDPALSASSSSTRR